MSSLDYLDLCRLCLMKDRVSVPIFEGEGDVRQIFLKIAACLPVKVAREDKLPKKICDDCVYKVELLYQFWNTTANAEKQLLQWLGEVGLEDKQGYVTGVLNPSTMKQEENSSSGLGGTAIQVTGVQPGIGIGVIDNMGLGMPLIIPSSTQQQLTAVPMDTSTGPIQPIQPIQQAVPGPSSQPGHEQIAESQTNATTHQQDEEEETSDDEENSDDDCDGDDGLPVKEESEEDPSNSRTIEPTTFVNVSLACDEAGPSGLQQQKIVEMPEMAMPQTTDGDPKSGSRERAGLRIIKTDSDGRFILGKDSVPIELRQRSNAEGKTSYSLVPVIGNTARISGNSKFELMTDTNEVTVDANLTETVPKPTSEESKYLQQSLAHLCQITMESYACEKCGIKFPVEHMLKRHKISHKRRVTHLKVLSNVIQTTHTCPSCNVKFLKKDNLNTHMRIHRVKEKSVVYLCSLCSFKCYERTTLSSHVTRKHKTQGYATHRERYQCTTCDYKCSKKDNLNAHMWRHRDGQSNSILSCKMCGFKSFKRSTLSSHVTRKHKRKREEKTMSAMMEEYCCNTCAYKTCKKENLQAHVLGHKEVVDEGPSLSCNSCEFKCEKGVPLASYVVDKHKAAEEFRCDVCDFKCFKKSTMYSHKRRHRADSDGKIYNCNECKFKTTKKTSLYSHIKRKHKVLTKNDAGMEQVTEYFYCNQCEYKNKNKYELKVHVARKHTDDFKFSCETCGKKFKVKGDLTNHIRFNHKEGPVICDVCGKTCLNSNSLYVHQKFAHYKAKYECHICKRRLVTQENLNEHMLRQHEKRENVVCEECGKTFSRNSRLKVHMRIHTGDKPYTCNVCGKSFARRTALKQHLLIHTGIRPYVCDICGKSFTQKPGLISHRKSHPGIHPPLPRVLIDHILNDVMNN
ncbi:zinc finger protein 665-like isoform X1 [Neodiprion pinetum]|uniref:zinc finger protein 665-like isoform X1 n=1 Tax=Neodiprion pinetum TaxID=441929 RepID=UPI0037148541